MGLLDLFRPKPKPCSACLGLSPGLHRVWSGLRHGEETDRLCTPCLIERLAPAIRGKRLLFTEPSVIDSYCFTSIGELCGQGLVEERVGLALDSIGSKCAKCTVRPQHLWLSQDDLDWDAMNGQRMHEGCWTLPLEPSGWSGALPLCDAHVALHLREYLEGKRDYFGTFRFPDSSASGFYW